MLLIFKNFKQGNVKIKIENLDDLWCLSHVIEKGDLVTGKTTRKLKLSEEGTKASVAKKTITLTLIVERIEFHKYSDVLRVSGKIESGPDDIKLASYHTLSLEVNSIIKIHKENWYKHQVKRIEEASKTKLINILIVVMDRSEACFAFLKKYGYDYLGELEGNVQKKGSPEKVKESDFYANILKNILEYDKRFKLDRIIIASPAFWKEEMYDFITSKHEDIKKKITQASCSAFGKNGIEEVLKRDEVKKILKEDRIIKEISYVEELFKVIAQNRPNCYGIRAVKNAADFSAIRTLLVTDDLIHKYRQEDKYEKLDNILKLVEEKKGEIHIISTEHEAGKRLNGLGGIAATLRFKIDY